MVPGEVIEPVMKWPRRRRLRRGTATHTRKLVEEAMESRTADHVSGLQDTRGRSMGRVLSSVMSVERRDMGEVLGFGWV